ncbi:MAG: PilZ domain-containing protein [Deltaproteobacteria bacterium]|nr:PilZ domain-containing protein [Deltaproteobacteria bacterium]
MTSKLPKQDSDRPAPLRTHSEVRPASNPDNRRQAERWPSDARVEILTPIQQEASVLDVSATGVQLSLQGWLSTGTLCDLRITTHTGREIYKCARVIWARRVRDECVAGLQVVRSIDPPPPEG